MGTDIGGNEGEDKGKVNGEDDGDNTWAWGTMMACGQEDGVRTGMWLCYRLTIFI